MNIKNKSQVSKAMFLAKYSSLALYDEEQNKRFIIDHEKLQFNNTDGWTLIGIPEKEYGSLSDREYFCIHNDLFDRIQSTHKDRNVFGSFNLMN